MAEQLRHFGKFRGEEVIIVGYKRSMNNCMICRVTTLPQDEAANLRQIAQSTVGQSKDYLVQTLQVERHKSGTDWFTYLVGRLYRNDKSVMTVPLKEIEEMNHDQLAFYKGYGKSVETGERDWTVGRVRDAEEQKKREDEGKVLETQRELPSAYYDESEVGQPTRDPEVAVAAQQAAGPTDPALISVLQQIVEGQNKIVDKLDNLDKKPARRSTKKKTTKSKPAA